MSTGRRPGLEAADMAHDHRVLRGALESLAGAQPPPPPGRCARIRELARRRRRQQAMMGATSAMVAVAVAAVGLGGLIRHPSPAGRHRPAWALSWPDHR